MSRVVIINGCGGSGKDEFVKQCRKHYPNTQNYSTVDNVKLVAQRMGWHNDKSERGRRFLSDLKELWDNYNHGATSSTFNAAKFYLEYMQDLELDTIIFIHCREPEKIDELKQMFKDNCNIDAETLLVTNCRIKPIESNHSDRDVQNYKYDWYIENDGDVKELSEKAEKFVKKLDYQIL